jgi:hypothetical protein
MAFFFHGTDFFGKTERVPGLLYVATQFDHVNLFPLFFKQTFAVLHGSECEGRFRGVPLPRSWKSIMLAYVRGISAAWIVLGSFAFAVGAVSGDRLAWDLLALAAAAVLPLGGTYAPFINRAKPAQAFYLASLLGIDPADVAARFVSADEIPAFLAQYSGSVDGASRTP